LTATAVFDTLLGHCKLDYYKIAIRGEGVMIRH